MTNTQHQTDHQLAQSVTDEIGWMPSVQADRIGVSINDGAVTLSGQVATYPEKIAAVRAALRVRGVHAVANEIEVHNNWAPVQDADIAREATAALAHTLFDPDATVKAEVSDHFITLTGTVTWNYQRDGIERCIHDLAGVRGVQNLIELKPKVSISAQAAKGNIAAALRRNADLDSAHIQVGIVGSTITLTGKVTSHAESRQATYAAWGTPGVTHVHNELKVNSY
ncbi:MAG: BON domain-containing protein [Actinomycetota bacterium]|nr:BON domain-containing protein [Actinomycetota bacterium]MDQ2956443.1 BON domain-containing protein [Actinomycetota bacterium]